MAASEDEDTELREPTSEAVMYHVFAAEFLGSEGDLQAAVGQYLEAAMESNDPEIAHRATRIAFAAQAWLQAAMAADRWALLDPDNVEAHRAAATALLQTGDYASAELQFHQIIQLMGNSTEAWILVSALLAQSADPERASVLLTNILATQGNVNDADARYAQSQLAVHTRDLNKAYELAQQAVELDPERIEFLTWAGRLALNLNKTGAGLAYIERAWKQKPEDHDLALAYADLLARTARSDEARKVMAGMKQTPDVMLSRIKFEINAFDRNRAKELLLEFGNMDFNDSQEAVFYEAQAAEALEMNSRAIELYGEVESGGYELAAGIRRVELMAGEGDVAGARLELAQMREQQSELVVEESWIAEARIVRETGDRKTALEILGKALEQLPDSIPIRYSHALLAAELGWVDIAEKDLRIIISQQPENAAVLNALGYTLADQTERYEEAEALIRQAYILQPDEASIVDSMGWIAYRLGRLTESEKFLRRAWALDRNPEIAAHLGEVLWVSGKQEAARIIWRDGMEVDSENPALKETLQRLEVDL
jgi:tetratricopeptide (TPR) repeat protein